jgi:predicted nucleic acid-binding protein
MDLASRLLTAERGGETSQPRVDQFLSRLSLFRIYVDDELPFRGIDVLNLARIYDLTVFNAAYLELALRVRLPLATIDASLTRAATAAGVSLFVP